MNYKIIVRVQKALGWISLLLSLVLLVGFFAQFLSSAEYPWILTFQRFTSRVTGLFSRFLPVTFRRINFAPLVALIVLWALFALIHSILSIMERRFQVRKERPLVTPSTFKAPEQSQPGQPPVFARQPKVRIEAVAIIDLVNSTVLLTRFGDSFLLMLRQRLNQQVQPIAARNVATYTENTGDGFLLFFPTMEKSVAAMQEIFEKLPLLNENLPEGAEVALRGSLNFGEVLVDLDSRRTGSAVYKTFRLESLSGENLIPAEGGVEPGEFPPKNYVLISEEALTPLAKVPGLTNQFLGLCELKGFPGYHRVYQLKWTPKGL